MRQRREHARPQQMTRRIARHRRSITLAVSLPALPVIRQRIARLTDSRRKRRTQKSRRRDRLIHRQLKFLLRSQRPPLVRQFRKKDRSLAQHFNRLLELRLRTLVGLRRRSLSRRRVGQGRALRSRDRSSARSPRLQFQASPSAPSSAKTSTRTKLHYFDPKFLAHEGPPNASKRLNLRRPDPQRSRSTKPLSAMSLRMSI